MLYGFRGDGAKRLFVIGRGTFWHDGGYYRGKALRILPRIYPRRAAVISWVMSRVGDTAFFTLVTTFVFAPYFAALWRRIPARGQALWGFATAAAGLDDCADVPGARRHFRRERSRKPWIAGFGVLLISAPG